ncbi:hypothetical protein SAMN05428989_2926 [Pseudoxanthomonas sp. GM95]|uniref:hypothetical protein n=1 Tax=Pseudoxanthomonas sp. GM95 TaxID=1881043 RepID=UPI0008AE9448|nr:hypothetical protein [Pseudoxanthomonas sp. GM95]SEL93693.1 hypothetical protein SAMN05428989_2926 [Pseudoxanthomonas sp. GM95]
MTEEGAFLIWDAVSMAWTEIGLDPAEYDPIALKLVEQGVTLKDLRSVARRDVCGAFALDSVLIFPCMLWMIMPDWGYAEPYLRRRMQAWRKHPAWVQYLHPMRWIGYPIAFGFSVGVRSRLERALGRAWALQQP